MKFDKDNLAHGIAVALIALLTLLIYSNAFYATFHFDDFSNIVESSRIKDLSNFLDISGTRYIGFLSFALNYYLDGLNPFSYHLTNILIHIINGILVYTLVWLTHKTPVMKDVTYPILRTHWQSAQYWMVLFTSIIFVAHPIQTQAITYIVQRFASLATLFYLLSLVFYIKFRLSWIKVKAKPTTLIFYLVSLFSIILAMKTKEISFTLPFIIVLYEFTFFASSRASLARDVGINDRVPLSTRFFHLLPLLITLLIIPLSRIEAAEGEDPLGGTAVPFSRWEYLFTEFRVMVRYIRLMFLPMDQNLDYNYPIYNSFFDPQVFLSFLFLLSVLGFAIYVLLRSRATNNGYGLLISFGLLWFFVTISVESSIIPLQNVIFEHRLYLPSVGIILSFTAALCYGFESTWKKWRVIENKRKQIFILTACFLLINSVFAVSLSIATYRRNLIWKNNYTLWADTVIKSPDKPKAHYNLGIAYVEKGEFDEAIKQYKKAIELDPAYADAHNNLGMIYQKLGMYDEAVLELKESLRINPNHIKAYNNLGLVYVTLGRYQEASLEYLRALQLRPDDPVAHNNLGLVYFSLGRYQEAIKEYRKAVQFESDYPDAYYNLGIVYDRLGRYREAIQEYQKTLQIEPDYFNAHNNLGNIYYDLRRYQEAIKEYQAALHLKPDHFNARNSLANVYYSLGRYQEAIQEWNAILSIDSTNEVAKKNLELAKRKMEEFR